MAELRTCPDRDELQRMILGQLPDSAAQQIQEHLECCPRCTSGLEECIGSDELLEAVQSRRNASCEPTKTIHLPIEWIRGDVSTSIRAHDTQVDEDGLPPSTADAQTLLDPPQSADEIGRIGDFRVLRVLGIGGTAVIFEAEDHHLKRRVALKLMHPAMAAEPGGTDRFLREAQSAATLEHEHIVTIQQVGMHGQTPFIALELLRGENLEEALARDGRPRIAEIVRVGSEVAKGLSFAHAHGLLHRDIKPANIWLQAPPEPPRAESAKATREQPPKQTSGHDSVQPERFWPAAGKVKILDFGCAKAWADESGITSPGLLIGTPAYMAPEQLTGNAVDPRTDLFSLGCVLYRMAAGKQPFGGADLSSVVRALALDQPVPVRSFNPEVPGALCELIGRLLSKSPDDRPATAQHVVNELAEIERQL